VKGTLEPLPEVGLLVSCATEAKTVSHVEEDVNVSIDTPEKFLTRSHGKDRHICKRVDTLCLVPGSLLASFPNSHEQYLRLTLEEFH